MILPHFTGLFFVVAVTLTCVEKCRINILSSRYDVPQLMDIKVKINMQTINVCEVWRVLGVEPAQEQLVTILKIIAEVQAKLGKFHGAGWAGGHKEVLKITEPFGVLQ